MNAEERQESTDTGTHKKVRQNGSKKQYGEKRNYTF